MLRACAGTDPLPLPETPKDPCANGHTGGKADCLHPAVCSVCGKSYGTLGDHVPGEPEVLLENDETMFTVIRCTVCGEILSKDPVEPEDEPGEDP